MSPHTDSPPSLNTDLSLTPNAVAKLTELLSTETTSSFLRIYIQGGGCSGLEYGFEFSQDEEEDDHIWGSEETPLHIRIDPISYQYLQGVTLDYRRDLQGERFVIKNPNAAQTCGCGNSFSVPS